MQLFPLKLIPSDTKIDFIKLSKIAYSLSILLMIVSIAFVVIYKFNLGIDFAGGISMEIHTEKTPDVNSMREVLNKMDIGEVVLQNFGGANNISIRISGYQKADLNQDIEIIKEVLLKNFVDYNIDFRKVDFVGPQIGSHLIVSGIKALALSFLAIMIYVWVRFEWQFGLGVVLTLIHDAVLCLGFMSIMQLDFNQATIAALLTIIGYSVNDSVVIYDRIRLNLKKYHNNNIGEIINLSVNQTLSRTTLTIITTLIANAALVIFGGEAIKSFSILVFVGIVVGTYSSIFVSASILKLFGIDKYTKG